MLGVRIGNQAGAVARETDDSASRGKRHRYDTADLVTGAVTVSEVKS